MKKRFLIWILIVAIIAAFFVGCERKPKVITSDEAQEIALEQAGLTKDQASDVHIHIVTEQGLACYSVHITTADAEFSYVISAADGTVLSTNDKISH